VQIRWPGWANDWGLYGSTNLMPPVVWVPVTNGVISNNNRFQVNIPIEARTRFFRLAAP
jgi:hypothetical protein